MKWLLLPAALAAAPMQEIPKPPTASPPGVVRIWGNPQMTGPAQAWADAFMSRHPAIRVELHLTGSDVAMAALYTGKADIALLGREATAAEQKAFEWIFRYRARGIPVLNGSVATGGQSPALAVLVHPSNPLRRITPGQLGTLLAAPDARWSAAGLDGGWAVRSVRIHMPHAESGTGRFLRDRVTGGDIRLAWNRIVEYADSPARGHVDSAQRRASEAVARDPDGLAIGVAGVAGTRAVAIVDAAGVARSPDARTMASGAYPLGRRAYAYVNLPEHAALDGETRAFLEYALSPAGEAKARARAAYLPLDPATRAEALRALRQGGTPSQE